MSRFNQQQSGWGNGSGDVGKLAKFADILQPTDAEEPVLHPGPRSALFEWLAEIRAADDLKAVGIKPRNTALLYGPPGCGKTTFAHHMAARLGLPLACIRSESLISKYLGQSGENIGQLFDAMKETQGKVVIFFDEIDSIGGKRQDDEGASVERASSLNVLLRRIEMFDGVALAATNREDFLDSALWRRFGMQIKVELPGPDERFAIIRRYIAPFDPPDEDIDVLAELTAGASPALLRQLMEGLKRTLVIGAKINKPASDPVATYGLVLSSIAMPPEFTAPPLWADPGRSVARVAKFDWPMKREDKP